jgi:hypothetical protein
LKRSEKLKERNHEVQTDCFGRPGQHMADFGGLGLQGIIMITHNGASTVRSEEAKSCINIRLGRCSMPLPVPTTKTACIWH